MNTSDVVRSNVGMAEAFYAASSRYQLMVALWPPRNSWKCFNEMKASGSTFPAFLACVWCVTAFRRKLVTQTAKSLGTGSCILRPMTGKNTEEPFHPQTCSTVWRSFDSTHSDAGSSPDEDCYYPAGSDRVGTGSHYKWDRAVRVVMSAMTKYFHPLDAGQWSTAAIQKTHVGQASLRSTWMSLALFEHQLCCRSRWEGFLLAVRA